MKILIIEPDKVIKDMLYSILIKESFDVVSTLSNQFLLDTLNQENPQLIIMNVKFKQSDGFYWCQKIREQSNIPIIFITTHYSIDEHINAINAGGDDDISLPLSSDLLLIKINALTRRTYDYVINHPFVLTHQGLTLNTENSTLSTDTDSIALSKNECQLLSILFRQQGQIVKRETLLRELWQDERFVDNNTLTVNINRIRKKMTDINATFNIQTKVKQGYFIA